MPDPIAAPEATSTPTNTQVGGIGVPPPKAEPPKPIKIKNHEFKSEDDAFAEIERGRQSGKLLTEAQKRLQESTKRDKSWEELKSEVKTKKDAQRVIRELGLSNEEAEEVFGKWLYENVVRPKEMDPRERRIKELEAEKAQFEESKKAQEKQRQDQELHEATQREEVRLKQEIVKVLSDKKIPGTRLAVRRLANYLGSYAEAGVEIPIERAADMVMEDYKQEYGELLDEASPEQLIDFLGEKRWRQLAKKVSAWALAKSKQPAKVPESVVQNRGPGPKDEKMTPEEFRNYLKGIK